MRRKGIILWILAAVLLTGVLSGCGGSAKTVVPDCEALYQAMEAAGILPEMVRRDAQTVYDYYGIDPEKCVQLVNYATADGLLADEVLLVETKDVSYAQETARMLKEQMDRQAETFREYMPEEYEKISAGKLEQNGTFVLMLVSEDVASLYRLYQDTIG